MLNGSRGRLTGPKNIQGCGSAPWICTILHRVQLGPFGGGLASQLAIFRASQDGGTWPQIQSTLTDPFGETKHSFPPIYMNNKVNLLHYFAQEINLWYAENRISIEGTESQISGSLAVEVTCVRLRNNLCACLLVPCMPVRSSRVLTDRIKAQEVFCNRSSQWP